jgi:RNA polymerase sigma-70 factor (ECF subfamily)
MIERLLVLRSQAGDESAFEQLVVRYHPRLSFFLRKLLGDWHAADDVLQEVWLDVLRSIGRLNDTAAFAAWVYRIARDRAYRQLRRKGVRTQRLESCDEELIEVAAEANGAFTIGDVAAVHAALDLLPPEHREVLVLRFLEEMSYEDISRATGSPLGTVRSRLHYAKRALRRALEGDKQP